MRRSACIPRPALLAAATLLSCALLCALGALMPAGVGALSPGIAEAKTSIASSKVTHSKLASIWYYTGKKVKPRPTFYYKGAELARGRDYRLSYVGNVQVGTARIVVTGLGRFKGTRTLSFKIRYDFSSHGKVSLAWKAYLYTGKKVKPSVTVKYGSKRLDARYYIVSYSHNRAKGTATVTVKGRRGYKGSVSKKFIISSNLAANAKVTLSRTSFAYTGTARKPVPSVSYGADKLVSGRDYTVSYQDNKKVGTGKVLVKGKNGYRFSLAKTFKITASGGKVVDLSEHNGAVTWSKLAPKVDLAILRSYVMYSTHRKASDNAVHRADYSYDSYASGCEKSKLAYGAYGYLVLLSEADAKRQADEFWASSFSNGHAPKFLVLDIEASNMASKGKEVVTYTKACIDELQALARKSGCGDGIKIGLYLSNNYYGTFGFSSAAGKKLISEQADFVWIPTYGKNTGKVPSKYRPSYAYDMWQYTSEGRLSGVSTPVDLSLIDSKGPKAHNMGWYLKR